MYKLGQLRALACVGLVKTAKRRLNEPDSFTYGDPQIPLEDRLNLYREEAEGMSAKNLPPSEQYQQESAAAGRTGGGIFGGALGGLGGAMAGKDLKSRLMYGGAGLALGGLAGAGLGHLGGKSVGKSDSESDVELKNRMTGYLGKPEDKQRMLMAALQSERARQLRDEDADLQRELAETPRRNINYNLDSRSPYAAYGPYGYGY